MFVDYFFDGCDVLISCEVLFGYLFGWFGVVDYVVVFVIWDFVVGYLCDKLVIDDVYIIVIICVFDMWLWLVYCYYL